MEERLILLEWESTQAVIKLLIFQMEQLVQMVIQYKPMEMSMYQVERLFHYILMQLEPVVHLVVLQLLI